VSDINPARSRFLTFLVAFSAGLSIMSIELAASRVLAPGFGGGIYVWGSLIGVVMVALSLTLTRVFPSVFAVDLGGNTVLIAFKRALTKSELIGRLKGNDRSILTPIVNNVSIRVQEIPQGEGIVFTDDKSAIEEIAFEASVNA
jgi:hypothetical protein